MNEVSTDYFVFDGDDPKGIASISDKISAVFHSVNEQKNKVVLVKYGNLRSYLDTSLACLFEQGDKLSICFDNSDITFTPAGHIIRIDLSKQNGAIGYFYTLTISIVNKGKGVHAF